MEMKPKVILSEAMCINLTISANLLKRLLKRKRGFNSVSSASVGQSFIIRFPMRNFLHPFSLSLFLTAVCLSTGCDNKPAPTSAKTDMPVQSAQSHPLDSEKKPFSKIDPVETKQSQEPVTLELNAPGGVSEAPKSGGVDHNDPTSYPVTKLLERQPGQLLMLSWNVESDGSKAETICQQLAEMNTDDRYDVIALSEVLPENFSKFRNALGKHYKYAYSKSGWHDRLQILYNEDKFEKVRHLELDDVNVGGRYRAPLVVQLKERKTKERPDELEFMVMVNHLARGKSEIRQKQAKLLVEWGREQNLPVFGLGDYNFDYVFSTDKGNPAFVNFMQDGIWRWVKPAELIDTNWFDNPDQPDGKDDYPGSMLDFAFVAGPAKDWKSTCTVIVRENDFPDDEKTSDHRPYELATQK